jgi:hypothetical protein
VISRSCSSSIICTGGAWGTAQSRVIPPGRSANALPNVRFQVGEPRRTGSTRSPNAHALPAIVSAGPMSADIPTGERAVRRELLHLLRDFSQSAILRDMSGNSADISKGYFEKPIGSLNPLWSASKSMILQEKMSLAQLCRRFRGLAPAVTRVGHRESEFLALCTFSVGRFSEGDFASGFLCE